MESDLIWLRKTKELAQLSCDPSSKFGCVIIDEDGRPLGTGYNGFPPGVKEDGRMLDRAVKYELVVHSEVRAILDVMACVAGCTMYCSGAPCCRCAVTIVEAGIRRVVCYQPTADYLSRWKASYDLMRGVFAEAGVEYEECPNET